MIENRNYILNAVLSLLSVCDGAQEQDGVGYNIGDAKHVRSLIYSEKLSDEDIIDLAKTLVKYRKQLERHGYEMEKIKPIETEKPSFLENSLITSEIRESWNKIKMNKGKYRGMNLGEIASDNISYIEWASRSFDDSIIRNACNKILKLERLTNEDISPIIHKIDPTWNNVKCPFGQYKGKGLGDIYKENPTYITEFLAEKSFDEKIKDAAIKIKNGEPLKVKEEKAFIHLDIKDKKIFIKSSFDYKDAIKEFENRSWHSEFSMWSIPLRYFDEIIEKFPEATYSKSFKEFVDKKLKLKEMSRITENTKEYDLGNFGHGKQRYPFQKAALQFLETAGGSAIIADEQGCIDGEALISLNRTGKGFKMKLSTLYERFNDLTIRKNYKWDLSIPTYARSLTPEGELKLNEIKKVIDKGIKPVLQIKTREGKELKLTYDHKIATPDGWIEVQKLQINNIILTNGIPVCKNCGSTENLITYKYARFKGFCKTCMYRQLRNNHLKHSIVKNQNDGEYIYGGLKYHPYVNHCASVHRLTVEADMNNCTLQQWLNKIYINDLKNCIFLPQNIDIHHINGNVFDNKLENLEKLTRSEHHIKHKKYLNFEIFKPKEDQITSIEPCGETHVFDIVMDDPSRNFVANGIIVHNCGKTIEALSYLQLHKDKRPALIVAPSTVKGNWKNEIQSWLDTNDEVQILKTKKPYEIEGSIVIINYDILNPWKDVLAKHGFKIAIFDEAHRLKNPEASRTKAAFKIVEDIDDRIPMTGTPILNRPKEIYSLLHLVDPKSYTNEGYDVFNFMKKYCNATHNGYGWVFSGASNTDGLAEELKYVMIRRTKDEVGLELPDKTRTPIFVELTNKTEYKKHDKEFNEWLNTTKKAQDREQNEKIIRNIENDLKELKQQLILANGDEQKRIIGLINRNKAELNELADSTYSFSFDEVSQIEPCKQVLTEGKMKFTTEWIDDFLESEQKLVVFVTHKKVVAELMKRYKDIAVKIDGTVPEDKRTEAIDKFQTDPNIKLFVGNIQAAGEGSTLTKASNVLFLEMPWRPSDFKQCEDRCHRIGQKNAVNVYYILARGTIDEFIIDMIENKRRIVDEVMGDKVTLDFDFFHQN